MAIVLLDTDHHLIAGAVQMTCTLDGKVDGILLVVTVTDHAALMVDDIEAVQRFVMVDMDGMI